MIMLFESDQWIHPLKWKLYWMFDLARRGIALDGQLQVLNAPGLM
jgi:hypothetical protein